MSDHSPRPPLAWCRAKNLVFAFVGVMTAYVLYHNERFLIEPSTCL